MATDSDSSDASRALSPSIQPLSGFLKLPPEIRDHIYEQALIQPHPINPWQVPEPSLDFFYVSRAIHAEATWIFYSRNTWDFSHKAHLYDQVSHSATEFFFKLIGCTNTGYIRHVRLDLSHFMRLIRMGGFVRTLDCRGEIPRVVRNECTGLSKLTIAVWETDAMNLEGDLERLGHPSGVAGALEAFHLELKAFMPSLKDVVIEMNGDASLAYNTLTVMNRLGWILRRCPDAVERAPPSPVRSDWLTTAVTGAKDENKRDAEQKSRWTIGGLSKDWASRAMMTPKLEPMRFNTDPPKMRYKRDFVPRQGTRTSSRLKHDRKEI